VGWDSYLRLGEARTGKVKAGEDVNYENFVTVGKTLREHLTDQCGEIGLDPEERRIASEIIGNLDDRGYLQTTYEALLEELSVSMEALEDVLDVIQRMDPGGVGARDLKECLLIQVRNMRLKNGVVEHIIENHLADLETRNYDRIAKSLKISVADVEKNVEILASLEPVPGRPFGDSNQLYVVPDVYLFKVGDEWKIALNEDGLPDLKISDYYSGLAEDDKVKKAEKDYLDEKIKNAHWLIRSIYQRKRTIAKVTQSILRRQIDFFEQGVEHLKPMILKDVSEDIEMHESTVSRVTTNKFIHTPRGVFELKYFFNNSVQLAGGEEISSEAVRSMIATFVKEEDPKKPYSDQKIVEYLEGKGIQLARRTVAKYREALGIPPSSKRKRFY
jgi:RNA polymerase sigma-54 factor